MNANVEDPLVRGHYEFKGEENYKPTSSFLQKVFLILNLQLSIILILQLFLGNAITQLVAKISLNVNIIIFIPELFLLVIFLIQLKLTVALKESSLKSALFLCIRAILFYSVIRVVWPAYINKEMTLFISLILSVHLIFTIYAYSMKAYYNWKVAILLVGVWAVLAAGFLFIVNEYIVKGLFTTLAIVFCVIFVLFYGLYLVYETGFIIDGPFYAINHHQYVFAALILQFDAIGLSSWLAKKCKKLNRIEQIKKVGSILCRIFFYVVFFILVHRAIS